MLDPDQFQINEAWILFKLNDAPVSIETEGDFNALALMDAASCFILATELMSANSLELSQLEAKRLLKYGYSHKKELPKKILIPDNQAAAIFSKEAEQQGIVVVCVPEEHLLVLVDEARQGFQKHVSGGNIQ